MGLKVLSLSGGGFKIAGHLGVMEQIMPNYKPDIICGTSAGALMAFATVCINWDNPQDEVLYRAKRFILHPKKKDIWKSAPYNSNGGFSLSAIWRAITGKISLGDMSNLKETIKKVVTETDWNNRKHSTRVYVCTVDIRTGHVMYNELCSYNYEDALNVVIASASIPVFTEPIDTGAVLRCDGGVRDHNPLSYILDLYKNQISESVSVYTRPKDYKILDGSTPSNVLKMLERTIDILNVEISKSDEKEEEFLSTKYGSKLTQLFLPKVLESMYDLDHNRLRELYHQGVLTGVIYNERQNK